MKKLTVLLMALVLFPVAALAALLEGTVEKVDQVKKQIVLNTDKGPATVEFDNATKGVDSVRTGAKVTINFEQKGEKRLASEIIGVGAGSTKSSPSSDRPISPGDAKDKSSSD
jgi:transcription elongation GreA/GreB family factor